MRLFGKELIESAKNVTVSALKEEPVTTAFTIFYCTALTDPAPAAFLKVTVTG